MSTEHSPLTTVRLLIAESSEQSAYRFDALLRDAGISTRMQLVDLADAEGALNGADLMLCNAALPQLERLLPQLRITAPDVPIILVDHRSALMPASDGLRLGAADVVSGADADQLVLVFKRELDHVCRTRRVGELHLALAEAEQRCQLLLQTSDAAIAYVHEGMHIHANDCYLKLFGFSDADEVLGLPLMDLLTADTGETLKQRLKRLRLRDDEQQLEFLGQTRDGSPIQGRMTLMAAQYEGESCIQVTVRTTPAVSAMPAPASDDRDGCAIEKPIEEAIDDPFSNAHRINGDGSGVCAFLAAAARLTGEAQACPALLVAQIDGYSSLQAQHGLRAAEALSAEIHSAMQALLGERTLARLSAHQFAYAAAHDSKAGLKEQAEALRQLVAELPLEANARTVRITISIGAIELLAGLDETDAAADAGDLLELALNTAFAAALRVSEDGGNQIAVISRARASEQPESAAGKLLASINDAIDNNTFVLLFQPIISLRGDASEHYEVFLRMLGRDGEPIAADGFLGAAIEHGVATKVDRWVILNAIKTLIAHRAKGHNTRLTINISANSIADPDFAPWLTTALKAARLPSDAVIFQFQEHDAANMVRQTQALVQGLKSIHVQSSLSQFGVVDQPFELLKSIPVDFVKVSSHLVERMATEASSKAVLIEQIGELQSFGKLTIVPKVETALALSVLWQAGVNFVQGYYLQAPTTEMNYDFSTGD